MIDLRRCESPPHALAPCLNSRALLRLVAESKGPDCTTESPLSAKTIETSRLHGQKDIAAPPGETDFFSTVSVAQADLAVSPFKNQPEWQIKKEQSKNQKVQSIPMQRAHGKENKKQRSLVPVIDNDISDSEDDFPLNDLPLTTKRSAVQRLPFSNSPVKRNALVVTQGKGHIRKPQYDPVTNQKQRWSNAERHNKLRSEFSSHKSATGIDM